MDDYYKHDDFVNNFNVCHIDNLVKAILITLIIMVICNSLGHLT